MDAAELTQFLEDNKDTVKKAVLDRVIQSMTQHVEWSLPKLIQEDVLAFYDAEIRPGVKQHLADNKEAVMQTVIAGCLEASNAVATAMAKKAVETMSTDWKARAVLKSLFE